jgi:hypothetical protein
MKSSLKLARLPLYPILTGAYAVTYLLSVNLGQVAPQVIWSSMIIAVILSALMTAGCLLVFREIHKAALASGLILLIFFSFGHVYDLIIQNQALASSFGYMKLLGVFLLVLGPALWAISRAKQSLATFTLYGNLIIGGLLLIVVLNISIYQIQARFGETTSTLPKVQPTEYQKSNPDIYYIVLDGYSRSDVLLDQYGYDNSAFIEQLEARGFSVISCAYSNYSKTSLSIASSLNMQYVDTLGFGGSEFYNRDADPRLTGIIHHNQVRQVLSGHGYQFVAFKGFFPINDIQDADHYYNVMEARRWDVDINERNFQYMAVRTTLLRIPVEWFINDPDDPIWKKLPMSLYRVINPNSEQYNSRSYQWYQQHMYTLEELERLPNLEGPQFIYAQIYATHQPFVMRSDGSFLWPINEDNAGYIPAVEYMSRRIIQVIDEILRKSDIPPIILLQADHGRSSGIDSHKILNAYYLPGQSEALPTTITPVNSFRWVLSRYFGEPYELLADRVKLNDTSRNPPEVVDLPVECPVDAP